MRKGRTDSLGRRLAPRERRKELLQAALCLAHAVGYQNVTREKLAEAAGCSPSLISASLGTIVQMRRAIMSAAVDARDLRVIAQGLVVGEAKAKSAPAELKAAAAASVGK